MRGKIMTLNIVHLIVIDIFVNTLQRAGDADLRF